MSISLNISVSVYKASRNPELFKFSNLTEYEPPLLSNPPVTSFAAGKLFFLPAGSLSDGGVVDFSGTFADD